MTENDGDLPCDTNKARHGCVEWLTNLLFFPRQVGQASWLVTLLESLVDICAFYRRNCKEKEDLSLTFHTEPGSYLNIEQPGGLLDR